MAPCKKKILRNQRIIYFDTIRYFDQKKLVPLEAQEGLESGWSIPPTHPPYGFRRSPYSPGEKETSAWGSQRLRGGGDPSSRKCGSAGKRWWADECLGRSPKNASPGQNRSDPTLTLPLLPFWKTNARLAPPPLHRLSPQSETGPDLRSIWIARKDQNRKKKPNDGNDGVYDPAVHPHLCLAAFFHSGSSVATIRYTANK